MKISAGSYFLPRLWEEIRSLPLPAYGDCLHPWAHDYIFPVSASMVTLLLPLLCLMRTLIIGFRAHMNNSDGLFISGSLTNYNCKDPFQIKKHSLLGFDAHISLRGHHSIITLTNTNPNEKQAKSRKQSMSKCGLDCCLTPWFVMSLCVFQSWFPRVYNAVCHC